MLLAAAVASLLPHAAAPSGPRRGGAGAAARVLLALCLRDHAAFTAAVPPVGHQPRRRTHAAAPPNRSSTLGRHWVPTADRPDAFKDRCSTSLAVAHLRNDDHPTQPHGIVTTLKRWACGWEPYRLVWFQTASSIEACSDHV